MSSDIKGTTPPATPVPTATSPPAGGTTSSPISVSTFHPTQPHADSNLPLDYVPPKPSSTHQEQPFVPPPPNRMSINEFLHYGHNQGFPSYEYQTPGGRNYHQNATWGEMMPQHFFHIPDLIETPLYLQKFFPPQLYELCFPVSLNMLTSSQVSYNPSLFRVSNTFVGNVVEKDIFYSALANNLYLFSHPECNTLSYLDIDSFERSLDGFCTIYDHLANYRLRSNPQDDLPPPLTPLPNITTTPENPGILLPNPFMLGDKRKQRSGPISGVSEEVLFHHISILLTPRVPGDFYFTTMLRALWFLSTFKIYTLRDFLLFKSQFQWFPSLEAQMVYFSDPHNIQKNDFLLRQSADRQAELNAFRKTIDYLRMCLERDIDPYNGGFCEYIEDESQKVACPMPPLYPKARYPTVGATASVHNTRGAHPYSVVKPLSADTQEKILREIIYNRNEYKKLCQKYGFFNPNHYFELLSNTTHFIGENGESFQEKPYFIIPNDIPLQTTELMSYVFYILRRNTHGFPLISPSPPTRQVQDEAGRMVTAASTGHGPTLPGATHQAAHTMINSSQASLNHKYDTSLLYSLFYALPIVPYGSYQNTNVLTHQLTRREILLQCYPPPSLVGKNNQTIDSLNKFHAREMYQQYYGQFIHLKLNEDAFLLQNSPDLTDVVYNDEQILENADDSSFMPISGDYAPTDTSKTGKFGLTPSLWSKAQRYVPEQFYLFHSIILSLFMLASPMQHHIQYRVEELNIMSTTPPMNQVYSTFPPLHPTVLHGLTRFMHDPADSWCRAVAGGNASNAEELLPLTPEKVKNIPKYRKIVSTPDEIQIVSLLSISDEGIDVVEINLGQDTPPKPSKNPTAGALRKITGMTTHPLHSITSAVRSTEDPSIIETACNTDAHYFRHFPNFRFPIAFYIILRRIFFDFSTHNVVINFPPWFIKAFTQYNFDEEVCLENGLTPALVSQYYQQFPAPPGLDQKKSTETSNTTKIEQSPELTDSQPEVDPESSNSLEIVAHAVAASSGPDLITKYTPSSSVLSSINVVDFTYILTLFQDLLQQQYMALFRALYLTYFNTFSVTGCMMSFHVKYSLPEYIHHSIMDFSVLDYLKQYTKLQSAVTDTHSQIDFYNVKDISIVYRHLFRIAMSQSTALPNSDVFFNAMFTYWTEQTPYLASYTIPHFSRIYFTPSQYGASKNIIANAYFRRMLLCIHTFMSYMLPSSYPTGFNSYPLFRYPSYTNGGKPLEPDQVATIQSLSAVRSTTTPHNNRHYIAAQLAGYDPPRPPTCDFASNPCSINIDFLPLTLKRLTSVSSARDLNALFVSMAYRSVVEDNMYFHNISKYSINSDPGSTHFHPLSTFTATQTMSFLQRQWFESNRAAGPLGPTPNQPPASPNGPSSHHLGYSFLHSPLSYQQSLVVATPSILVFTHEFPVQFQEYVLLRASTGDGSPLPPRSELLEGFRTAMKQSGKTFQRMSGLVDGVIHNEGRLLEDSFVFIPCYSPFMPISNDMQFVFTPICSVSTLKHMNMIDRDTKLRLIPPRVPDTDVTSMLHSIPSLHTPSMSCAQICMPTPDEELQKDEIPGQQPHPNEQLFMDGPSIPSEYQHSDPKQFIRPIVSKIDYIDLVALNGTATISYVDMMSTLISHTVMFNVLEKNYLLQQFHRIINAGSYSIRNNGLNQFSSHLASFFKPVKENKFKPLTLPLPNLNTPSNVPILSHGNNNTAVDPTANATKKFPLTIPEDAAIIRYASSKSSDNTDDFEFISPQFERAFQDFCQLPLNNCLTSTLPAAPINISDSKKLIALPALAEPTPVEKMDTKPQTSKQKITKFSKKDQIKQERERQKEKEAIAKKKLEAEATAKKEEEMRLAALNNVTLPADIHKYNDRYNFLKLEHLSSLPEIINSEQNNHFYTNQAFLETVSQHPIYACRHPMNFPDYPLTATLRVFYGAVSHFAPYYRDSNTGEVKLYGYNDGPEHVSKKLAIPPPIEFKYFNYLYHLFLYFLNHIKDQFNHYLTIVDSCLSTVTPLPHKVTMQVLYHIIACLEDLSLCVQYYLTPLLPYFFSCNHHFPLFIGSAKVDNSLPSDNIRRVPLEQCKMYKHLCGTKFTNYFHYSYPYRAHLMCGQVYTHLPRVFPVLNCKIRLQKSETSSNSSALHAAVPAPASSVLVAAPSIPQVNEMSITSCFFAIPLQTILKNIGSYFINTQSNVILKRLLNSSIFFPRWGSNNTHMLNYGFFNQYSASISIQPPISIGYSSFMRATGTLPEPYSTARLSSVNYFTRIVNPSDYPCPVVRTQRPYTSHYLLFPILTPELAKDPKKLSQQTAFIFGQRFSHTCIHRQMTAALFLTGLSPRFILGSYAITCQKLTTVAKIQQVLALMLHIYQGVMDPGMECPSSICPYVNIARFKQRNPLLSPEVASDPDYAHPPPHFFPDDIALAFTASVPYFAQPVFPRSLQTIAYDNYPLHKGAVEHAIAYDIIRSLLLIILYRHFNKDITMTQFVPLFQNQHLPFSLENKSCAGLAVYQPFVDLNALDWYGKCNSEKRGEVDYFNLMLLDALADPMYTTTGARPPAPQNPVIPSTYDYDFDSVPIPVQDGLTPVPIAPDGTILSASQSSNIPSTLRRSVRSTTHVQFYGDIVTPLSHILYNADHYGVPYFHTLDLMFSNDYTPYTKFPTIQCLPYFSLSYPDNSLAMRLSEIAATIHSPDFVPIIDAINDSIHIKTNDHENNKVDTKKGDKTSETGINSQKEEKPSKPTPKPFIPQKTYIYTPTPDPCLCDVPSTTLGNILTSFNHNFYYLALLEVDMYVPKRFAYHSPITNNTRILDSSCRGHPMHIYHQIQSPYLYHMDYPPLKQYTQSAGITHSDLVGGPFPHSHFAQTTDRQQQFQQRLLRDYAYQTGEEYKGVDIDGNNDNSNDYRRSVICHPTDRYHSIVDKIHFPTSSTIFKFTPNQAIRVIFDFVNSVYISVRDTGELDAYYHFINYRLVEEDAVKWQYTHLSEEENTYGLKRDATHPVTEDYLERLRPLFTAIFDKNIQNTASSSKAGVEYHIPELFRTSLTMEQYDAFTFWIDAMFCGMSISLMMGAPTYSRYIPFRFLEKMRDFLNAWNLDLRSLLLSSQAATTPKPSEPMTSLNALPLPASSAPCSCAPAPFGVTLELMNIIAKQFVENINNPVLKQFPMSTNLTHLDPLRSIGYPRQDRLIQITGLFQYTIVRDNIEALLKHYHVQRSLEYIQLHAKLPKTHPVMIHAPGSYPIVNKGEEGIEGVQKIKKNEQEIKLAEKVVESSALESIEPILTKPEIILNAPIPPPPTRDQAAIEAKLSTVEKHIALTPIEKQFAFSQQFAKDHHHHHNHPHAHSAQVQQHADALFRRKEAINTLTRKCDIAFHQFIKSSKFIMYPRPLLLPRLKEQQYNFYFSHNTNLFFLIYACMMHAVYSSYAIVAIDDPERSPPLVRPPEQTSPSKLNFLHFLSTNLQWQKSHMFISSYCRLSQHTRVFSYLKRLNESIKTHPANTVSYPTEEEMKSILNSSLTPPAPNPSYSDLPLFSPEVNAVLEQGFNIPLPNTMMHMMTKWELAKMLHNKNLLTQTPLSSNSVYNFILPHQNQNIFMYAFVVGASPRIIYNLMQLQANPLVYDSYGFTAVRWGLERVLTGRKATYRLFGITGPSGRTSERFNQNVCEELVHYIPDTHEYLPSKCITLDHDFSLFSKIVPNVETFGAPRSNNFNDMHSDYTIEIDRQRQYDFILLLLQIKVMNDYLMFQHEKHRIYLSKLVEWYHASPQKQKQYQLEAQQNKQPLPSTEPYWLLEKDRKNPEIIGLQQYISNIKPTIMANDINLYLMKYNGTFAFPPQTLAMLDMHIRHLQPNVPVFFGSRDAARTDRVVPSMQSAELLIEKYRPQQDEIFTHSIAASYLLPSPTLTKMFLFFLTQPWNGNSSKSITPSRPKLLNSFFDDLMLFAKYYNFTPLDPTVNPSFNAHQYQPSAHNPQNVSARAVRTFYDINKKLHPIYNKSHTKPLKYWRQPTNSSHIVVLPDFPSNSDTQVSGKTKTVSHKPGGQPEIVARYDIVDDDDDDNNNNDDDDGQLDSVEHYDQHMTFCAQNEICLATNAKLLGMQKLYSEINNFRQSHAYTQNISLQQHIAGTRLLNIDRVIQHAIPLFNRHKIYMNAEDYYESNNIYGKDREYKRDIMMLSCYIRYNNLWYDKKYIAKKNSKYFHVSSHILQILTQYRDNLLDRLKTSNNFINMLYAQNSTLVRTYGEDFKQFIYNHIFMPLYYPEFYTEALTASGHAHLLPQTPIATKAKKGAKVAVPILNPSEEALKNQQRAQVIVDDLSSPKHPEKVELFAQWYDFYHSLNTSNSSDHETTTKLKIFTTRYSDMLKSMDKTSQNILLVNSDIDLKHSQLSLLKENLQKDLFELTSIDTNNGLFQVLSRYTGYYNQNTTSSNNTTLPLLNLNPATKTLGVKYLTTLVEYEQSTHGLLMLNQNCINLTQFYFQQFKYYAFVKEHGKNTTIQYHHPASLPLSLRNLIEVTPIDQFFQTIDLHFNPALQLHANNPALRYQLSVYDLPLIEQHCAATLRNELPQQQLNLQLNREYLEKMIKYYKGVYFHRCRLLLSAYSRLIQLETVAGNHYQYLSYLSLELDSFSNTINNEMILKQNMYNTIVNNIIIPKFSDEVNNTQSGNVSKSAPMFLLASEFSPLQQTEQHAVKTHEDHVLCSLCQKKPKQYLTLCCFTLASCESCALTLTSCKWCHTAQERIRLRKINYIPIPDEFSMFFDNNDGDHLNHLIENICPATLLVSNTLKNDSIVSNTLSISTISNNPSIPQQTSTHPTLPPPIVASNGDDGHIIIPNHLAQQPFQMQSLSPHPSLLDKSPVGGTIPQSALTPTMSDQISPNQQGQLLHPHHLPPIPPQPLMQHHSMNLQFSQHHNNILPQQPFYQHDPRFINPHLPPMGMMQPSQQPQSHILGYDEFDEDEYDEDFDDY